MYEKVSATAAAGATNQPTKIEGCVATIQLVEDTEDDNYYKFDPKIITVYYKNKSAKVLTVYAEIPLPDSRVQPVHALRQRVAEEAKLGSVKLSWVHIWKPACITDKDADKQIENLLVLSRDRTQVPSQLMQQEENQTCSICLGGAFAKKETNPEGLLSKILDQPVPQVTK